MSVFVMGNHAPSRENVAQEWHRFWGLNTRLAHLSRVEHELVLLEKMPWYNKEHSEPVGYTNTGVATSVATDASIANFTGV